MKQIIGYIKNYFQEANKIVLSLVTALTATMILLNYNYEMLQWITNFPIPFPRFAGLYILFLVCFGLSYLLYVITSKNNIFKYRSFLSLLFLAPALFALKMTLNTKFHFSPDPFWDHYINKITYWPILLITIVIFLLIIWRYQNNSRTFYGLTIKEFNWKPYAIMIVLMVPFIAMASTQFDFLQTYPKIKTILPFPANVENKWFYAGLYELSYGLDFLTVELFFRGFLVLAFVKYAGKNAILPMAIFYCAIHFGKPLAECISSYFGGILLGIIVYHSRSITGGLLVHVAIAWMMEIGGYIGNIIKG